MENKEIKEINAVIQVCKNCGKIDVYKGDGHICDREFQEQRELNQEYYD